ncbi:MAG: 6-carboxytetrahydropterin synthase [Elusimicrobiales bacterium]|jgi:6-pyruvoyltetrahydropterin/6-carboxytetrahydropterin synthase|nr:6-carboxytetrahydropterin synthase [Elusimicrobiales bacterium]
MYKIKKTFHLAYGHRLLHYKGKCENLHGHNALIEVTLKSEELNSERMVMDFTELGAKMKTWLDENLDHRVILAGDDPLAAVLEKEGQRCFLTGENPTAEVLARLIFEAARELGLPAAKVAFWETPTSMASYKK